MCERSQETNQSSLINHPPKTQFIFTVDIGQLEWIHGAIRKMRAEPSGLVGNDRNIINEFNQDEATNSLEILNKILVPWQLIVDDRQEAAVLSVNRLVVDVVPICCWREKALIKTKEEIQDYWYCDTSIGKRNKLTFCRLSNWLWTWIFHSWMRQRASYISDTD